jgi:hypothetical protein
MAVERKPKDDHLLYADAVGSRGKSGVWFGEVDAFQAKQAEVMEAVKEAVEWVPLDGAVLAVSIDPPGIAVIAPNPSLPGVIVLADGATPENEAVLKARYTEIVSQAVRSQGISTETE